MSYQKLNINFTIKGFLLATVHKLFPDNIPTVSEFAEEYGISRSALQRGADWLLELLPRILRNRKPGPKGTKNKEKPNSKLEKKTFKKLSDLRKYLEKVRKDTPKTTVLTERPRRGSPFVLKK